VTLHEHAARARDQFTRAGIPPDEAALDARLLAQFLLGWDAARFVTAGGESGPEDFSTQYHRLVERRAHREPLAYIIGRREFWGLDFEVSPAVLIPRPETELIIETALELLPDRTAPFVVADACTGSGCIAVALAREYPASRIVATDVSSQAIGVATRNVAAHGLASRITLLKADILLGTSEPFDLIVSNPPYVPDHDREALQPEVRDYEPAIALFAGASGMAAITRLLEQATARLAPHGQLVFEFGFGQASAVEGLIGRTSGLTMVGLRHDLQTIPRVAIARRT